MTAGVSNPHTNANTRIDAAGNWSCRQVPQAPACRARSNTERVAELDNILAGLTDGHRIPPALAARVEGLVKRLDLATAAEVEDVLVLATPWLAAAPALAEVGVALLDPRHEVAKRALGCAWLAKLPGVDTAKRLAVVALDAAAPPNVRDAAIAALGARAVHDGHPSTWWPPDAVQIADDALFKLADAMVADGRIASRSLPRALRHVASEASSAVIARAPSLWGDAIECFATPALARVLYVAIDDLPARHRLRALRLIAAALGEEALPLLRARSARDAGERLEARLLAVAVGGEAELPALDDLLLAQLSTELIDAARGRARWHLANRSVVPSVRGMRVARVTATLPVDSRAAACGRGADDLAALAAFERYADAEVYAAWAWLVRGAGDPARAAVLVDAHPPARSRVVGLYLTELARRGRVRALVDAAHAEAAVDRGALLLAIHGRPLAALALADVAPAHTAELCCARSLALYRAARPVLAERVIAEDLPPAEVVAGELAPFPGVDERWRIANAPADRPALAAIVGGVAAVRALAQAAPDDAEPDATTLAPIVRVERRLARELRGAVVYVAGSAASGVRETLAAAGARVVAAPLPDVDFFIAGAELPAEVVARLERAGARRLRGAELRDP
jgi:hypothetical protein